MGTMFIAVLALTLWGVHGQLIDIKNNNASLKISQNGNSLKLLLTKGSTKLEGLVGIRIEKPEGKKCDNLDNCFQFNDIRLHVTSTVEDGFSIYWETRSVAHVLEDCFELKEHNWYGGPERWVQQWPVEKLTLENFANVPQEKNYSAVTEPYWLNSAGGYIFVNEKVPLFVNQNTASTNKRVCFSAKMESPYPSRSKVVLHYTIVGKDDAKQAHEHAVKNFLGKPSGHPNYHIIEKPIWSTWAKYKRDVSDDVIKAFAKEIEENGYDGQFEIDDDWEDCYGALTFNQAKFGKIKDSVEEIKKKNFTVTLWVHPFINIKCEPWETVARKYDFLVKNTNGSDLTSWWNSKENEAHYLDFSKTEVQDWFLSRLRSIQQQYGIDSFKFDAGETSWSPQVSDFEGDVNVQPNNIVIDYVKTCAKFGDLVEVRSAYRTQDLPIFVRMIDKDSRWGSDNGLYTLITTLLQMNMNGYTLVLPDMVGGNGYNNEIPGSELFVRWVQANVFMPSIQFSYVPWDYKSETKFSVVNITKNMVDLHKKFSPYILKQLQHSVNHGAPVNPPIWWVDPANKDALKEDTEFLLGSDLLAAPVIEEGKTWRRVVLPAGSWIDGISGEVHKGPLIIEKYTAPIEVLPYFVREGSEPHSIWNGVQALTSSWILYSVVLLVIHLVHL